MTRHNQKGSRDTLSCVGQPIKVTMTMCPMHETYLHTCVNEMCLGEEFLGSKDYLGGELRVTKKPSHGVTPGRDVAGWRGFDVR